MRKLPASGRPEYLDDPGSPLTRSLLEQNGFRDLMATDAGGLVVWSEADHEISRQCAMLQRPEGPIWIFAYGSLLWNPTVCPVEQCVVRILGWRRTLSVIAMGGRGSRGQPGLVLGLEPGGSCEGLALRLDEASLEQDLRLLWRREMITGAYTPLWLNTTHLTGEPFGPALTFITHVAGLQYAGKLHEEDILNRVTRAKGWLGSNVDYLQRTCRALRDLNIPDHYLESLRLGVRYRQQDAGGAPHAGAPSDASG